MKTYIKKITVTYSCGHTKIFGIWQVPKKECWCHSPAIKIEIIDEVQKTLANH